MKKLTSTSNYVTFDVGIRVPWYNALGILRKDLAKSVPVI